MKTSLCFSSCRRSLIFQSTKSIPNLNKPLLVSKHKTNERHSNQQIFSQDTASRKALKIHFKNKLNGELEDISDFREYEHLITRCQMLFSVQLHSQPFTCQMFQWQRAETPLVIYGPRLKTHMTWKSTSVLSLPQILNGSKTWTIKKYDEKD